MMAMNITVQMAMDVTMVAMDVTNLMAMDITVQMAMDVTMMAMDAT